MPATRKLESESRTYTSAFVDNAPSPANVSIQLRGGNAIINTLTFRAAGQPGDGHPKFG